jgi:hypothetical protein
MVVCLLAMKLVALFFFFLGRQCAQKDMREGHRHFQIKKRTDLFGVRFRYQKSLYVIMYQQARQNNEASHPPSFSDLA